MLGIHALIGIGEAIITVAALAFIMRVRPDVLSIEATVSRGGRGWVVAGIAVALIVVLFAPWASADPDGLERVAEDLGFLNTGLDAPYQMFPDYTIPMFGETGLSTIVAGIIGVLIVAAIAIGIGRLLRRPPKTAPESN
jgi:cobalt/nickel transport system permease protein